jgi:hypothetical protein
VGGGSRCAASLGRRDARSCRSRALENKRAPVSRGGAQVRVSSAGRCTSYTVSNSRPKRLPNLRTAHTLQSREASTIADLASQETADTSQNAPPTFSTRGITTVGDPATEAVYSASGCWGPGMLLSGGCCEPWRSRSCPRDLLICRGFG